MALTTKTDSTGC